jgi:acetyl esterase
MSAEIPLSGRERVESRIARAMGGLPSHLQVFLSGRPPVTIDGQTLEPEIQLMLAALERQAPPALSDLSVDEARARYRTRAAMAAGEPLPVQRVRSLVIEGAAGPLGARLYTPAGCESPCGMLVFLHGGGFVVCDLDTHDAPCRILCQHGELCVLSVDYRLAPEHPFPAAVEDARAALAWALEHAEELGADPGRVAIGGDSAGGTLATVASFLAADDGSPTAALQLLLYPGVDSVHGYPSDDLFGDGFGLTLDEIDWFNSHYAGGHDLADPRISPLLADELPTLPTTLMVSAGFDPLRDEGDAYVEAMRAADTTVHVRRFSGLVHGFANMAGISPAARAALIEVARETRVLLDAES